MKIEALHNFHDEQFAQEWSTKFKPTEERLSLFNMILDHIDFDQNEAVQIVELGIGPAYLADYILSRESNLIYEGLDFSLAMLNIASKRLEPYTQDKIFTQADLTSPLWKNKIKTSPNTIISTWALHDLLSKKNIDNVYTAVYEILPLHGQLINGDFIKPETSTVEYEKGRIKPSEHIELLKKAGFSDVKCLQIFEEDIAHPTTSNNYACFLAKK